MRTALSYIITLSLFGLGVFVIVRMGEQLPVKSAVVAVTTSPTIASSHPIDVSSSLQQLVRNIKQPLSILLLQMLSIIIVSRIFGYLLQQIKQPSVIGEIIAGIVLGPSLMGWVFPEASHFLFSPESIKSLQFISQIGLVFFMFTIGMELDFKLLKGRATDAVVVSHASIIVPFFLGMLLSYFIYTDFAPVGVKFLPFSLFMGIAMSITAFPVLARIIKERNLSGTSLGTLAITCAAADDVTAWCVLALVVAIAQAGTISSAVITISLSFAFVMLMFFVVRPFLLRIRETKTERHSIVIAFLVLLISAYCTEIIGIHALFGAFIAGIIMPEMDGLKHQLTEKIEDVSLIVLMPVFFACTGLNTQIGLLNTSYMWVVFGFILLVAVTGKFVGSAVAAKWMGQSTKDSLSVGALMNTRGLMQLIVLNIGYSLGILTPEVFAMMILMALVTTLMTSPFLDFVNWMEKRKIL